MSLDFDQDVHEVELATRKPLELLNSDGSLMAFICPSMPEEMRRTLYPKLKGCFNGVDVFKKRTAGSEGDTDEDELEHPFSNIHFSWWNRYGVSVRVMMSTPEDGTLKRACRVRARLKMFILTCCSATEEE